MKLFVRCPLTLLRFSSLTYLLTYLLTFLLITQFFLRPSPYSTFHSPSFKQVRLRDELLRAHNAMGAMKRELDRRNADLESLVASHQENLDNTGTDLKDTGVKCGCAVLCCAELCSFNVP